MAIRGESWAVGYKDGSAFVAGPHRAFLPIKPGQINETYPGMKQYDVIVVGKRKECVKAERTLNEIRGLMFRHENSYISKDQAIAELKRMGLLK
jgi:hypothetical protein